MSVQISVVPTVKPNEHQRAFVLSTELNILFSLGETARDMLGDRRFYITLDRQSSGEPVLLSTHATLAEGNLWFGIYLGYYYQALEKHLPFSLAPHIDLLRFHLG